MKKLFSKIIKWYSIEIISLPIPPTEKKGRAWPLWFFLGLASYGLEESFRNVQQQLNMRRMEHTRQCLEMEPRKLNTTKDVHTLGFERVVCKGIFDKQRSIYVGPKPRSMAKGSENGFYVITPLLPIPNEPNSVKSPILVNRGWVPWDWEEKSLESIEADHVVVATANESRTSNKLLPSQPNPLSKFWYKFNNLMIAEEQVSRAMHVEVVGIVRKSENPDIFYSIANYPGSLAWFFLDIPKLAQAMGFGEDTIYVEEIRKDMDENRPYPTPRDIGNLIFSKTLPQEMVPMVALWRLISLACFLKGNSCFIQRYAKCESIGLGTIQTVSLMPLYAIWKIYSHRNLFFIVDTIGVGCVTKLDPRKKDQVKGWDRPEIDERTWTMNLFT